MQHLITSYGLVAVFLLMLAESACIPIPSELIMTFAGAVAGGAIAGAHLNIVGVIIAGLLGNVAGSYVAWAVGRYAGLPALRRWGNRVWIREDELNRAISWFDRYGARAVLIGRLLPVVRTFISLPAGIARMEPVRFGIYTAIGCIPWTAALAAAGYAVGTNWQSISNGFHGPTYIIAAIVVLALLVAAWRFVRRHRGQGPRDGYPHPDDDVRGVHGGPGRHRPADERGEAGRHR